MVTPSANPACAAAHTSAAEMATRRIGKRSRLQDNYPCYTAFRAYDSIVGASCDASHLSPRFVASRRDQRLVGHGPDFTQYRQGLRVCRRLHGLVLSARVEPTKTESCQNAVGDTTKWQLQD